MLNAAVCVLYLAPLLLTYDISFAQLASAIHYPSLQISMYNVSLLRWGAIAEIGWRGLLLLSFQPSPGFLQLFRHYLNLIGW
jgi:hypothetical protein